jgi:hypothetical protein
MGDFEKADDLLEFLRARPPAGTWVPIPGDGTWPGPEGFITKEAAMSEAKRRRWPAIGRVVDCEGGWTTEDHWEVEDA